MATRSASGSRTRTHREVRGIPRSGALSLWRTAKEEVEDRVPTPPPAVEGARPRLRDRAAFLGKSIWNWLTKFVGNLFKKTRPLPPYTAPLDGMFVMPDEVGIALAADWGTGTTSAYAVGDAIRSLAPDITIHLGDVYYSGTRQEYEDYFLANGCWPRGSLTGDGQAANGTYVLNANHEMYSGGEGYFGVALKELGQQTSYFCLHNRFWRIVALDTGYHVARGIRIVFSNDTRLPDAMLNWLRDVVFRDTDDGRPVILLSHHQWFSAFDKREYPKVGAPLTPYLDQVALWFWGHEHRLAGYAPFAPGGAPAIRARCIGHGGMPIELNARIEHADRPVVFEDNRNANTVDGDPIGYCGFAHMTLQGPVCTVRYIDETNTPLLTETWTRTPGGLTGSVSVDPNAPGLKWHRPQQDLVR